MRYHFKLTRMAIITIVGEDMEKLEHSHIAGGKAK